MNGCCSARLRVAVRDVYVRRGAVPGRDRGSATVWSLAGLAVLCVVFGAVLAMGQAMVARHRAAGGADLAALAAADHWADGDTAACARADRVARAQSARLVRCVLVGEISDVTAASGQGPFEAEVRARAGPAEQEPEPASGQEPEPASGQEPEPASGQEPVPVEPSADPAWLPRADPAWLSRADPAWLPRVDHAWLPPAGAGWVLPAGASEAPRTDPALWHPAGTAVSPAPLVLASPPTSPGDGPATPRSPAPPPPPPDVPGPLPPPAPPVPLATAP